MSTRVTKRSPALFSRPLERSQPSEEWTSPLRDQGSSISQPMAPHSQALQSANIETLVYPHKFQLRVKVTVHAFPVVSFYPRSPNSQFDHMCDTDSMNSELERSVWSLLHPPDAAPRNERSIPRAAASMAWTTCRWCPTRPQNPCSRIWVLNSKAHVFTWEFAQHGYWFLSKGTSLRYVTNPCACSNNLSRKL